MGLVSDVWAGPAADKRHAWSLRLIQEPGSENSATLAV